MYDLEQEGSPPSVHQRSPGTYFVHLAGRAKWMVTLAMAQLAARFHL